MSILATQDLSTAPKTTASEPASRPRAPKLLGLEKEILEAREKKLIAARELRRQYRMGLTSTSTHLDVQAAA